MAKTALLKKAAIDSHLKSTISTPQWAYLEKK
jgi:hypothetical protein